MLLGTLIMWISLNKDIEAAMGVATCITPTAIISFS